MAGVFWGVKIEKMSQNSRYILKHGQKTVNMAGNRDKNRPNRQNINITGMAVRTKLSEICTE